MSEMNAASGSESVSVTYLEEHLNAAKSALSSWAKRQDEDVTEECATHEATMDANNKKVGELVRETETLRETAKNVSKEELAEAKKVKEIKSELQLVQEREALLPNRLDEYLTLTQAEEGRVLRDRNELEDEGKVKHKALAKIKDAVNVYSERLGLSITRTEKEDLAFVFTQIDEKLPHEEFAVHVHVSQARKYEVVESKPSVPSMDELVEKLNKDEDFSAFIRATRRAFKTVAAERNSV